MHNKNKNIGTTFLQSIKNIETIKFEKCISMFHDLNDLLIIFYEKDRSKNYHNRLDSSTRKIFINSNSFMDLACLCSWWFTSGVCSACV